MGKEGIKNKYLKDGKIQKLSAQAYHAITDQEKADLVEALADTGQDSAEYIQQMTAMFPKKVELKELTWRKR